jgi:hypothetical protein
MPVVWGLSSTIRSVVEVHVFALSDDKNGVEGGIGIKVQVMGVLASHHWCRRDKCRDSLHKLLGGRRVIELG